MTKRPAKTTIKKRNKGFTIKFSEKDGRALAASIKGDADNEILGSDADYLDVKR